MQKKRGRQFLKLPSCMERMTGIEPAYSAWEADVLPMNYIRVTISIADPAEKFNRKIAPPGDFSPERDTVLENRAKAVVGF